MNTSQFLITVFDPQELTTLSDYKTPNLLISKNRKKYFNHFQWEICLLQKNVCIFPTIIRRGKFTLAIKIIALSFVRFHINVVMLQQSSQHTFHTIILCLHYFYFLTKSTDIFFHLILLFANLFNQVLKIQRNKNYTDNFVSLFSFISILSAEAATRDIL